MKASIALSKPEAVFSVRNSSQQSSYCILEITENLVVVLGGGLEEESQQGCGILWCHVQIKSQPLQLPLSCEVTS